MPQAYSRAWADTSGQIAVRRRDGSKTFKASTENVGVEGGLYGKGLAAAWREKNFGAVEASWPALRDELVSSGHLHGAHRAHAALFMALQFTRTREHIASSMFIVEVGAFAGDAELTRDVVREFMRKRHSHDPDDLEVEAAWTLAWFILDKGPPTFDQLFSMTMDIAVTKIAPLIEAFHWRVETVPEPVLWMCDRPVMPWRPPSERDEFEGVGLMDCHEVRMPLSPTAMLIMGRKSFASRAQVKVRRFMDYNEDIALQCYELIACVPGRRGRLDSVRLAPTRPAVRFTQGSGFQQERDGSQSPIGDIMQTWTPLRAYPD